MWKSHNPSPSRWSLRDKIPTLALLNMNIQTPVSNSSPPVQNCGESWPESLAPGDEIPTLTNNMNIWTPIPNFSPPSSKLWPEMTPITGVLPRPLAPQRWNSYPDTQHDYLNPNPKFQPPKFKTVARIDPNHQGPTPPPGPPEMKFLPWYPTWWSAPQYQISAPRVENCGFNAQKFERFHNKKKKKKLMANSCNLLTFGFAAGKNYQHLFPFLQPHFIF